MRIFAVDNDPLGLIGLRGQIVTAMDLQRRIGLLNGDTPDDPYHLVVNAYGSVVWLQLDRIGDVLEIPSSEFDLPPESLKGIDARYLEGVFMRDDGILAAIDLSAVLNLNRSVIVPGVAPVLAGSHPVRFLPRPLGRPAMGISGGTG